MISNAFCTDNDLGGTELWARNSAYAPQAQQWPVTMPWTCARNRNCLNGTPTIANWVGNDGEHAGPIITFANDAASVYGNS